MYNTGYVGHAWSDAPYDGGESIDLNNASFHSALAFKIAKGHVSEDVQERIDADMGVLRLIDSMHSLDPFLFKSRAEQQETADKIHEAYFAISPQEWDKIRIPIREKIQKLVTKALATSRSAV